MIVKKRKVPLINLKLEALLRRIPTTHPKYPLIKENLAKRSAGYQGELSLNYPLSFLDEKKYFIFHDLRLNISDHYFQIDTLVISQKFILIIEVKNITGTLFFDQEFHQLIRTQNGEEAVFPDPITQIKRQRLQLKQWLTNKQIPAIPIVPLVVVSHPNAIIQTSPKHQSINQIVVNRYYLSTRINQIERNYQKDVLSSKDIKKINRMLLKEHVPLDTSVLDQYEIKSTEVGKGVVCAACSHLPMIRVNGAWYCEQCQISEKESHVQALKDYYLLYGSQISNKHAREFLMISSPFLASRILKSMKLPSSGITKGKTYELTFKEFQNS
ncbi:nuclease-related domain-containing protein [Metabacillus halosaccharovorans]|uniref:nuclease-related domain-containing protein n=1 Tax=Metabacillus halosaccharovorans TaxID=930124 RepID=UPI003735ECCF